MKHFARSGGTALALYHRTRVMWIRDLARLAPCRIALSSIVSPHRDRITQRLDRRVIRVPASWLRDDGGVPTRNGWLLAAIGTVRRARRPAWVPYTRLARQVGQRAYITHARQRNNEANNG